MLVPIWTMPDMVGSSVEVISSARAHRRQRRVATCTAGRVVVSMLCRTTVAELIEFEDGRSESDDAYEDEAEEDEDEDETLPAYGTCGGRVAVEEDMMGKVVGRKKCCVYLAIRGRSQVWTIG
jgi:hypothetical protein